VEHVADLSPKSLHDARRQYTSVYAAALVSNGYLKVLVVLLLAVIGGLLTFQIVAERRYGTTAPIIIRVDETGRAQAMPYDASQYRPDVAEMRYYLTRFVVLHYARIRTRVHQDYPQSLFFLARPLTRDPTDIEAFLTATNADEIEINVQNVSLIEHRTPPFKASIAFQKVYLAPGARTERRRESYIAQLEFDRLSAVPNELITVNPLGFQLSYLHVDQAFLEGTRP